MTIEHAFDIPFVAALALKEKQIQQNYRPIIAVHKWFARRPGTLFRGLLLSEFGDRPLQDAFFERNDFPGLQIADPFMGGGTPLIEANRLGCDCQGFDVNPMSAWIVREELAHLDLAAYDTAAADLTATLAAAIDGLYPGVGSLRWSITTRRARPPMPGASSSAPTGATWRAPPTPPASGH